MSNKTLFSFISGVALGAVLGIILAPSEGKKAREDFARYFQNFGESLTNKAEEFFKNFDKK